MYPIGPWVCFPSSMKSSPILTGMPPHCLTARPAKKVTFLFGNAYSVLSSSEEQEAAFEFMKFVTGTEGDQIRQDAGFEIAPIKTVAEGSFLAAMEGKKTRKR